MPVSVMWDDQEQTAIRMDIQGNIHWDDIHMGMDQVVQMMHERPERVDLIINAHTRLPAGNPLPHLRAFMEQFSRQSHSGVVIGVTQRESAFLLRMFFSALIDVFKFNLVQFGGFAATLDEARRVLAQVRSAAIK